MIPSPSYFVPAAGKEASAITSRAGTGDGLLTRHKNRNRSSSCYPDPLMFPSITVPFQMDRADVEFQIHRIEAEAYAAVLRAFSAQSDALSWDKEGLISDLRKELRISDVEHRELLPKIDVDELIMAIRKWRRSTASQQNLPSQSMGKHVTLSESMENDPFFDKKRKMARMTVASSPGGPPQPSSTPILSSLRMVPYNDNKWCVDDFAMNAQGNVGQVHTPIATSGHMQIFSQGRGPQEPVYAGNYNLKKGEDTIQIRKTDMVIREVQRLCQGGKGGASKLMKAKKLLRDHEKSLLEAIEKLADVSDEGDPNQQQEFYDTESIQWIRHGSHHTTNTLRG